MFFFHFEKISTHRQTDQQTLGLIGATCRCLKIAQSDMIYTTAVCNNRLKGNFPHKNLSSFLGHSSFFMFSLFFGVFFRIILIHGVGFIFGLIFIVGVVFNSGIIFIFRVISIFEVILKYGTSSFLGSVSSFLGAS